MLLAPASYLALVVVLAVGARILAWAVRVPAILLLLLIGFALGHVVSPDAVLGRDVLFGGVTLSVGIVLFEGSLSLRLRGARGLGRSILGLCTVTVAVAWALITLTAWLLGYSVGVAMLVASLLVVTGPTVIAPILQQLRPTRRVAALLRWEGIVVDPIGAVLAVLVFQALVAGTSEEPFVVVTTALLVTVGVAVGTALVLGILLEVAMRRHLVPDYLHGATFLAAAVGAMEVSNHVQAESGLLTVTILGIYLANRPGLHLEHVMEFKEHLQVVLVGVLFVILAGRVSFGDVVDILPKALPMVLVLVLLIRPISVVAGLLGRGATKEERRLLSFMAPRGIVAAAVTSVFALQLGRASESVSDPAHAAKLARLGEEAQSLVPLVFVVIVATVTIYGLGIGRLAERLGLATTSPQGVVLAGGSDWLVRLAQALQELKVNVVVVSGDHDELARARMAGVRVERANILSDYAVRDMDLAGVKSLLAATGDDERNSTASREFARVLGRAKVYQLARGDESPGRRTGAADYLTGRTAFRPPAGFADLEERSESLEVHATRLTSRYTVKDYRAERPGAIICFTVRGREVEVATDRTSFSGELTVVALVPAFGPERSGR